MTAGIERLNRAADVIDHMPGTPDGATAALLRAVAAEGNPVWTRTIWGAASALADVILGGGDE